MKNIYRLIGLFSCFFASFAMACSCAYSTLAEKVERSENIFIVETYKIETIEKAEADNYSGGKRHGYFKVLDTLKGSSAGNDFISSAEKPICCMCQSEVKNNTQYLVFNSEGGEIYLSSCGFTQSISNSVETSEIIKAMLLEHKPAEAFTGIYISDKQLFLNDDGTSAKILELERDDYFAKMSRVSFEAIKLPSGKFMVTKLLSERTLSEAEIRVVGETQNDR